MRKPHVRADEASWRRQVSYLMNRVTISTALPDLGDMQVGEMRMYDAQSGTASDYILHVKVSDAAIIQFTGVALIGAEFDSAFSSAFTI